MSILASCGVAERGQGSILVSDCFKSPDGKYLASGAIDGIINIFDIATGKLLHTLEGEVWNS